LEQARCDERGHQSAQAEKQVQQVVHSGCRQSAQPNVRRQAVCCNDNHAAAYAEHQHQAHDGAISAGHSQSEQRQRDQQKAEHQSGFHPLHIHHRADKEGPHHESDRLRHGNTAVLLRSE
jgi:hypothetical protein